MKSELKALDCETVRARLGEFVFNKLGAEESGRIQGHLLECENCALAQFDLIESSLQTGALSEVSMPAPPPPAAPAVDEVELVSLAAAPAGAKSEKAPFSKPDGENFIEINGDEYILTFWDGQEKGTMLVGLKIQPGFEEKYEGKSVTIEDANRVALLAGEIHSGEVSERRSARFVELRSPLKIMFW